MGNGEEEQPDLSKLQILPEEMFEEILKFFVYKDLLNFSKSSKNFNKMVEKFTTDIKIIKGKTIKFYKYGGNHYLTLSKYLQNNFSIYQIPKRGGWSKTDKTMITHWYKVRINPTTLMVNNGDFTFSKTHGQITHHKTQVCVPWGTCFDCETTGSKLGRGNMSLLGTEFYIKDNFIHSGYQSNGEWKFQDKNQIVNICGGGYCGWVCPQKVKTETEAFTGGWFIQLDILE